MMETNLPDSGFLTCFYYTGRHTTDFACDARDENQLRLEKKMRAAAARHAPFTPPAPDAVTLGGPSPLGEPWRFYYSHGNIYLDDSYFYNTLHQVEMHAVTGLRASAPCTLHATLWSYDAVDLWVNGRRAGGIDLPCYKPIRQTELDLPLQAAYGICLLRLSGAGFHYHRAGILRLAAAAVLAAFAYMAVSGSHAVGPTRFVAVTALVLEFAGEYCEYSGHMAILDREDGAMAGSWERLRRWLSGMTAVSFGAALCALLRVLGLLSTLAALASMLGLTVVEVIKLSLLYRTAEAFRRN